MFSGVSSPYESMERVAIITDDIFQAVGVDKAEIYVKTLLNLIEYPSTPVEKIAVIVRSSDRVTRAKVGRHSWSTFKFMWNMSMDGFKQLYDQIPGDKQSFEYVWIWAGGNPRYLI